MTSVKRIRMPAMRRRAGANGEPADIMYQNVMSLLNRAYAIHKLDADVEEVLRACMPRILDQPKSEHDQWKNLEACLNYASYVQFVVWTGTTDTPFWMKAKQVMLTPVVKGVGIRVNTTNPHFDKINEWLADATALDVRFVNAKLYIHRTFDKLKHPKWVAEYWPEIVPYIGKVPDVLTRGLKEPRPSTVILDSELAEWINTTLTACVLLPTDYDCQAWPGLWPERDRG